MPPSTLLLLAALLTPAAATTTAPASGAASATAPDAWIRVNLVGYLPDDPKIAILSSAAPHAGEFTIGDLRAPLGPDQGPWGPFAHNYRLDFSTLKTPGEYRLRAGGVSSPPVHIGPDVYAKVPRALLGFMKLQRCGHNPVTGEKCHQQDALDTRNERRVDLTGGWHDAGDRLKHMITTSYCVAALRLAGAAEEAAYGADLLRRIHPDPQTLYVQIGDDRDHAPPETLWHDDQTDYGWGPGGPRPAWPALGKPQGPKYQNESTGVASLAGRCAAALALEGDRETAESLFRLAEARPGCAMSIPVKAPYYYGESTWHDDMEWAAAELYRLTQEPRYLRLALEHARQAGASRWMGRDRHGHYEFFPYVNLGHWRLYPLVDEAAQQELAGFYRTGLEAIRRRAEQNPYRIGTPFVWCSTNDVIAFATQAVLYEQMTGDTRYRALAAEARDWIFGRNPWGKSFVIGVPSPDVAASRPHHLFYKLADILPTGGLVDGPVYKDINDSLKFADFGTDELARFQSDVAVYHNVFADFSTNEPIIDGTVSLLFLLHAWDAHPNRVTRHLGAPIRGDTSRKEIALVFTGDEYGEGTATILDTLRTLDIRAGFFLTGNYMAVPGHRRLVRRMLAEGHYVGPHSHAHLLYCDWSDRDKTLVTREKFVADLERNLADLRALGALPPEQPVYFIPPYEWYNANQVRWARELGITLFNFTPGSGSNRDWIPEDHPRFVPAAEIRRDVLAHESTAEDGLNGFILLLHLGSQRSDKMHPEIAPLLRTLCDRGYRFARIDRFGLR
jgi:endoglucanase